MLLGKRFPCLNLLSMVGKIEASSENAYPGVKMCRSLSLDGLNLTDRFTCESEEEHVYDYTLILRDSVALPAARCDTLPEYERISNVSKGCGDGS